MVGRLGGRWGFAVIFLADAKEAVLKIRAHWEYPVPYMNFEEVAED